jgi:hypothetical protein
MGPAGASAVVLLSIIGAINGGILTGAAWFLVDALVDQPKPSIYALLLTAAGIPFYFIWRRKPGTAE